MTESFVVNNIHCASCIRRIEDGLGAVPGVSNVRVNLTTKRMAIDWDAQKLSADDIVTRLADMGFEARLFRMNEKAEPGRDKLLLKYMAVAGFAAANVMLLSVSIWAGSDMGSRNPRPAPLDFGADRLARRRVCGATVFHVGLDRAS